MRPRTTRAAINYVAADRGRPRYHANDHSRDTVVVLPREVDIIDGRDAHPSLGTHGFELVSHVSMLGDFSDPPALGNRYRDEISELMCHLTGADHVVVNGYGVLRYGERSALAGTLNNSLPARFAHIDISDQTASAFAQRSAPEQGYGRVAAFNIWRAFTPPPQDVPLALCDARTVAGTELIASDAIFDEPNAPEWSFEGLTVAWHPDHRWFWFSEMRCDEVLVFVTNDSEPSAPHSVPHCAFDHPDAAAATVPRGSIEMRVTCYWRPLT